MNKAFKVVFNAVRGKYMVVNEKTSSIQRGAMKGAVVAAAAAVAAATAPQALAATYTAGHGTTDQYIAYTSSNPDTGYHKETATDSQGKTVDVAVKDGFTISMLTDNKRFPGSSNGYVIQVFGTEWDQNGTLSTFGHNVNTISSSYTETAIGGALNSTNASAFVGAVNSSYTTVSMSGDTNIKVGDSWVNGYNYFVTPETDSKLVYDKTKGVFTYNGEVIDQDYLYSGTNVKGASSGYKVGVFVVNGKVYTGDVYGNNNEILKTAVTSSTGSDGSKTYTYTSYWGAEVVDPNATLATMRVSTLNSMFEVVAADIDNLNKASVKTLNMEKAADGSGQIYLETVDGTRLANTIKP